jgi:NitT/TauT family transport system permease protein
MGWSRALKPLSFFLSLVVLWQLATLVVAVPHYILPSPWQILTKIWEIPDRLLEHTLYTLFEVLAGFLLAVVGGVALASLIVHSRFLAERLYPLLVITQVTPQVAVAPILVVWFGAGDLAKILVAFLVSFFPMVVNTATGLQRVDPELLDLVRAFGTSRWRIFVLIRLPNALPFIFAGMRISIALAVIGAVVGEFVAASKGLGYLVFTGTANLDTRLTFASIAILATLGITLFWLVGRARRLALPWAADTEEGAA